jgi:cobalt-zinc-cadmium efflux system membrane fusion protein
VLRYPSGAPQLTMIQAQALAASRVPLADALSARIVYDEDRTARIGVAVSGRIVAIGAAPGDAVKAGQVLAEIDSPDYGAASADRAKARADVEHKRQLVERARELVPGDAIPLKDFEALQADLALARAESQRASERLKNLNALGLQISGQRMKLTSPMRGVVVERTATPALEVSSGTAAPLFVVTDPTHLWLLVDLPESLLARVRKGGVFDIESDAFPGEHFSATVAQLGQVVDVNTRRVTVRARLDNPAGKLLPEMFVRARLLADSGVGVRVPNTALVNQGVFNFVFIQTGPAEFRRQKVSLLTQGGDGSYVGEGLKGGEKVVTTGALLLDADMTAQAAETP